MAQVTIKINGYAYTVGCEDGQESHLQAMAAEVENRIDSIKALGGSSGEARLLMLASLLMADELHDLKIELEAARGAAQRAARRAGADKAERPDTEGARRLSRLAARAEQIANGLEHPPQV
jgi:cell division protein ZapA